MMHFAGRRFGSSKIHYRGAALRMFARGIVLPAEHPSQLRHAFVCIEQAGSPENRPTRLRLFSRDQMRISMRLALAANA